MMDNLEEHYKSINENRHATDKLIEQRDEEIRKVNAQFDGAIDVLKEKYFESVKSLHHDVSMWVQDHPSWYEDDEMFSLVHKLQWEEKMNHHIFDMDNKPVFETLKSTPVFSYPGIVDGSQDASLEEEKEYPDETVIILPRISIDPHISDDDIESYAHVLEPYINACWNKSLECSMDHIAMPVVSNNENADREIKDDYFVDGHYYLNIYSDTEGHYYIASLRSLKKLSDVMNIIDILKEIRQKYYFSY